MSPEAPGREEEEEDDEGPYFAANLIKDRRSNVFLVFERTINFE